MLRWELNNNSMQPRNLTENRQSNSLNRDNLLFLVGELLSMKMMCENKSSWSLVHVTSILGTKDSCFELSISRPVEIGQPWPGVRFSPYSTHVIGGMEALDGQHGHIIFPGWGSHLPADHSCNEQYLENVYNFSIIILWLGKFFF
jgi:hypothetical protein